MAARRPRSTTPRLRTSPASPRPRATRPALPRPAAPVPDSRQRILSAAATEFALRGFAAAGVDRIAARARLNKAMIYYHFRSKQNLYRTVLRGLFGEMGDHLQTVASSSEPPLAKLDRFVDVFVREGERHPHLAPIVLREVAEGGRRLDEETYTLMLRIVSAMMCIVEEGRASGQFAPVDPVLFYLTTVWPIMVYLATEPIRSSIARIGHFDAARLAPERFIHHLQTFNRKALAVGPEAQKRSTHASPERHYTETIHD